MNYKIVFPSGYKINSFDDDNLDINLVLDNNKVYFATLFTIKNIQYLIEKNHDSYFWADDMIIVKDLRKDTINQIIKEVIDDNYLKVSFSKIGNINNIFGENVVFSDIVNMTSPPWTQLRISK